MSSGAATIASASSRGRRRAAGRPSARSRSRSPSRREERSDGSPDGTLYGGDGACNVDDVGRRSHGVPFRRAALPVTVDVRLYHSPGCHLCERARAVVAEARRELGFELTEVDIRGDVDLEAAYREWLPVVEIGGRRA